SLINSTVVGHGDCLATVECDTTSSSCNGSETVIMKNNIFQGYSEFNGGGDTTCYMWLDNNNYYDMQLDYNIIYGTKIGATGYSANDINGDPLFINTDISAFNGHLQSGSPGIDSGLSVGALSGLIPAHDLEGNSRPHGAGVDRGAYEYGSTATPSITVTSPNGGENWAVASSQSITWTSTGTVGNVKIEISVDSGGSWSNLISTTTNDGGYSWTVPDSASTNCLIRISETDGSPTDTGDAVFTIGSGTGTATLSLSRSQLNFGACQSYVTGSRDFLVSEGGGGALNWTASTDQVWLSCTPVSGGSPGVVTASVDVSGLSAGTYSGEISIRAADASNSPQKVEVSLTVYSSGAGASPFGDFALPVDGTAVSSSIAVSGWVLDDIEVKNVKIYRGSPGSLVYIGEALMVEGARPDVEAAYPAYPMNYKAGWGYMLLTNFLPDGGNGAFTLHAIAEDVEGNRVSLGSKNISCDNLNAVKPFGAIDAPASGGTVSGADYRNAGWVLTPLPNTVPTSGSTIRVYIDGALLGNTVYNRYREDIATLFPGYNNSNHALAYFDFDTTPYANGVHTIYWTAQDDAGNSDGIGSRYFTIQNTGGNSRGNSGGNLKAERATSLLFSPATFRTLLPDTRGGVEVKFGGKEMRTVYPGEDGKIHIAPGPAGLLEMRFPHGVEAAYLLIKGKPGPLPVGASFNKKKAAFNWCPGPAFMGRFSFVFICRDNAGKLVKKLVLVSIGGV
ncbi:MAG: hypothetical protein GY765_01795, partial [bacterium]|nr:hypothetical protein [bacterium]